MPPKQQSKAELAKKQKIVEDKTFGLKNKNKSKNVQRYVQSLKQNVQPKPDATTKVRFSSSSLPSLVFFFQHFNFFFCVDPKSILCEFYKAGQCAKGFKCKFSHDLNIQRKGEKIDLYSDKRDQVSVSSGNMEDWDQETLEKVVESKVNEYKQNKPTDIVCKYFLEAVEKKQYGWFWVCPNGGKDCHYRHALPSGYVLKSQMKALLEEESEKIPIEEEIENQRAKITTSTPMTPELFMEWKKKKMAERDAGLAALRAERAKNDRMSGRELFLSDSSWFVDDVEAYEKYQREEESNVIEQKVDLHSFLYIYPQSCYRLKLLSIANVNSAGDGPSTAATAVRDDEVIPGPADDDDDELDMDELNELEASLTKTSIEIK
ncbi:hypothetical protein JRO89_XS12G0015900 [Xanthoceras sorbifolium]|uniref:C3H1-type domain-containing protein n=1 Tax=Xanthoceras sorbifolium TaxID=99658 RepID=A0ABQ8HAF4_9ROSI|nr:hypothetical protein JRO89_XS12G0015900 [Xanthoceras sorbifolium]